ncbi:MAG: hypothetical protein JZU50_04630 [Desulfobulbaceae bacterium]|nr:hypothetical protein [Desulfobulbaceae bacterium]
MTGRKCSFPGRGLTAAPLLIVLLSILLFSGCARRSGSVGQEQQMIAVETALEAGLERALAPSFLLQGTQERHNRVGRAEAIKQLGRAQVTINTAQPIIYAGRRPFTTSRGTYTNLVYRIHFPATPFSWAPFHLGAGDHVGLLVILTLDARQRPLLVTTANTCGCYAISIPTAALPPSSYPDHWPTTPLSVYGEQLPARLPALEADETLQVAVRAEVHRVMGLSVVAKDTAVPGTVQQTDAAGLAELDSLKTLPLGDGTYTSFYYERWPMTGHVKGAIKPWESLLLSLVSLDFWVGMDKEYVGAPTSTNPFYTSLKPWNRSASDLNDFAAYLRFNGWKL